MHPPVTDHNQEKPTSGIVASPCLKPQSAFIFQEPPQNILLQDPWNVAGSQKLPNVYPKASLVLVHDF